uniref:Uncharacterized protein n=1 Tax=viral metagenome TaxID=1070528 RepID=A0A6M3MGN4_9ZZZZ
MDTPSVTPQQPMMPQPAPYDPAPQQPVFPGPAAVQYPNPQPMPDLKSMAGMNRGGTFHPGSLDLPQYNDVPGYERLRDVLERAMKQASRDKGAERHANDKPFHEQPMQVIADEHGEGFILGQARKKVLEAQQMVYRCENDKAVHELLGAIVYLAGAVIHLEK